MKWLAIGAAVIVGIALLAVGGSLAPGNQSNDWFQRLLAEPRLGAGSVLT